MKAHVIRKFEELLSLIFALLVIACIVIGVALGAGFGGVGLLGGLLFGAAIGYLVGICVTGVLYILLSINDHLAVIRSDVESEASKSETS